MPQQWFMRNAVSGPLDMAAASFEPAQAGVGARSVTSPERPVTMPKSAVTLPKRAVTLVRNTHLTNNTALPALTIAALYKSRWQVELFFKCTYVLIAIVKKELHLDASLYTCLQILSVSVFEKTEVSCALQPDRSSPEPPDPEPIDLVRLLTGHYRQQPTILRFMVDRHSTPNVGVHPPVAAREAG